MCPFPTVQNDTKRKWSKLVAYCRACLEHEQMQRLQASIEKSGFALLRGLKDQIITGGEPAAVLSDPTHVQQVRQFLARKPKEENMSLCYGFPLVMERKNLIPSHPRIHPHAGGDGSALQPGTGPGAPAAFFGVASGLRSAWHR